MKIAVIHAIFKPETRGGAETAVANIVSGLQNKGDAVVVICVGRKNIMETPTPPAASRRPPLGQGGQLSVYRVKPFNLFNFLDINQKPAWLRLPWHLIDMFNDVQAWRVYRILKKEKPDVVLTHNLKGLGYEISCVIRALKIKHIHTVHDMQLLHPSGLLGVETGQVETPRNCGASPLVAIYRFCCRRLFGSPEVVIFPSQYIKGVYEKFGFFKKSKRVVLGNPIVIPTKEERRAPASILKLPPLPEGGRRAPASRGGGRVDSQIQNNFQNPSSASPWKGEELSLLFLGQVEKYKGILELIEAVKGIKGDFCLNVVGEGKALSEAKIRAQEAFPEGPSGAMEGPRIRFWGRLGQRELEAEIWPKIGLLVNPSQTPESFGMVVIEAFSHGVPALVSDKGALPELVRENETGWVFQNQNDLENKLEWCIGHNEEISKMKEICLREAEKYDVENYLKFLISNF